MNNRYAKVPLPATGVPKEHKIHGWRIKTVRNPILSSVEIDAATDKLQIPMPEMIFGNNYIEIAYLGPTEQNSPYWTLRFDTLNALDRVDKTGTHNELVQVAHSKAWQKSSEKTAQECPDEIHGILKPFDWTYTTDYRGDVSSLTPEHALQEVTVDTHGEAVFDEHAVPFDKLKKPEPIEFYDEVVLYEDELGDNGIVSLSVKVRVMPHRLLLLARLFLRVDGVLFRVRDTRVYIDFDYQDSGAPRVIREYTEHEDTYDSVRRKIPRAARDYSMYLRDENWVAAHTPVTKFIREYSHLKEKDEEKVGEKAEEKVGEKAEKKVGEKVEEKSEEKS